MSKEIEVNQTGIVQINDAQGRSRASYAGTVIKLFPIESVLTITKKKDDWLYDSESGSWINESCVSVADNDSTNITETSKNEQTQLELNRQFSEIEKYTNSSAYTDDSIADSLLVHNLAGIYGIPYQFMDIVDPRLVKNKSEMKMGRKYSEKIISKMPLLCITPGKVEFMSNFTKKERKGIISKLLSEDNSSDTEIGNIISKNGRYFTFSFAYEDYFQYVNGLCRAGARFLDIQDQKIDIGGTIATAKEFNWSKALNKKLKATFTSQEFIGFYMDSTDSVSESFDNETTQSQLSSTVNGVSDIAREIGFLLGAGAGKQIQVMDANQLTSTMETIDSISDQYLNGSTLFKSIANDFATIAIGGKLLFPEIWADSTFSRSFDITIKLRTPDCDVLSWYLNIYVPLCHLIALAAGHQTKNANGYYSPFLVRAFYKGLFNVDMGIVSSMSITKGKESAWNIDGLPTEVDVNLTIKDLYNMLSITPGSEPKNFVTNNIMMDYIANTCGININQMDIQRSLEIYYILTKDKYKDLPNKVMRRFQDAIDTYSMDLYNSVLNNLII